MKIINLLNMIANDEEVPRRIKLNDTIFVYQGDDYLYEDKDGNECWLFSEIYTNRDNWLECFLNDDIEIIENKKLEKFNDYIPLGLTSMSADFRKQDVFDSLMKIGNKINEIIDVINRGD